MTKRTYRWIELSWRPLKEGLHDSGYRYLKTVGVWFDENKNEHRDELWQWADHAIFEGPVNIDVTRDGVLRIGAWGKTPITADPDGWFGSDAWFSK